MGCRVVRSRLCALRHGVRRPRIARVTTRRRPKRRRASQRLACSLYFVSFAAIGSPDTTWARAISWLPITAPIAMPTRIAMGAASWWEPVVAAALTLAAIAGLVVLGGRVYTAAVLHSGPTLKLRDVWQHTDTSHAHPPLTTLDPLHGQEGTTTPSASNRQLRSATIEALIAAAAAGLTIVVTSDVIIGVAVGAGTFALMGRVTKPRRQPPPTDAGSVRPG